MSDILEDDVEPAIAPTGETTDGGAPSVRGCFGPDGLIKYVSPDAVEILGYEPADLVGRPISYFFARRDMVGVNEARDALVRGEAAAQLTVRPRRRRGFRKAMDGEFTAMFDTITGAPHLYHFKLVAGRPKR